MKKQQMIAHLLLYGNKVFYISPQYFSCKFLFLFIFLCQANIQQARKYGYIFYP